MQKLATGKTHDVAVKTAAHGRGHLPASPHTLDLKSSRAETVAKAARSTSSSRGAFARLRQMLDEHIHLHDLRVRTVSIRQRGWKDFPPASAKTMGQALVMTVARFFQEHPLADLTILTVIHLAGIIVWRFVIGPVERGIVGEEAAVAAPGFLPVLPFGASEEDEYQPENPAIFVAAMPQPQPRFSFAFANVIPRGAVGFAAAAMLFVLPFGAYSSLGSLKSEQRLVLDQSLRGVSLLKAAGDFAKAQDFGGAHAAFDAAADNFDGARRELGALGKLLDSASGILPANVSVTAAAPLLTTGKEAAVGGAALARGLAALDEKKDPIEKIRALRASLEEALPHLELASNSVTRVTDGAVPDAYREELVKAKRELPRLVRTVRDGASAATALEGILGADGTKRYLVIFQNNAELRPTGGFIGSFALIDVANGKIKNMEVPGGGSYDLKGSLSLLLSSPQPLHLINPRWEFQDANWYPDFPSSARQLSLFYGKAGGPTTDGVIAVNATIMEKLLAVTGPVEMPEYGKTITAQNFFYETQKEVELDYDKAENKPKKFIGDLAPKVLQRVIDADRQTSMKLAGVLEQALAGKELQFWFTDEDTQSRVSALGWSGEIRNADGDYVYVVHTNIAGQKTDLVMKDDIEHATQILPDGTGIVTLTVKRTHGGMKGALFSGVRNVDYMRVYVPKGSTLIEASGFAPPDPKLFKIAPEGATEDPAIAEQEREARTDRSSGTRITEESGKTVFGNWLQTDPGQTSVVTFVYRLPPGAIKMVADDDEGVGSVVNRLTDGARTRIDYSLVVQKQSGANPATFTSSVDLPRGFYVTEQLPTRTEDERGRLNARTELRSDVSFTIGAESR
jgi:hypothetical protein